MSNLHVIPGLLRSACYAQDLSDLGNFPRVGMRLGVDLKEQREGNRCWWRNLLLREKALNASVSAHHLWPFPHVVEG